MSKELCKMLDANAAMTAEITEAIKRALQAGLDASDVIACLNRLVEMLEAE